uniref:Transposase n=1 Tax=Heterorhabditis bacteriophora TaxID=37862 RepID=A0A1I7XML1_HETBA
MDKAKKRFASALDGFRSIHNRTEVSIDEKVLPEFCCLTKKFTRYEHKILILNIFYLMTHTDIPIIF